MPQFDPEIASIFTEEATELLESGRERRSLRGARILQSAELRGALKRPLHTLKGGARMAGIQSMGDLSHELETLVLQIDQGAVAATPATFDVLQASIDELARLRDAVAMGRGLAISARSRQRIRTLRISPRHWSQTPRRKPDRLLRWRARCGEAELPGGRCESDLESTVPGVPLAVAEPEALVGEEPGGPAYLRFPSPRPKCRPCSLVDIGAFGGDCGG